MVTLSVFVSCTTYSNIRETTTIVEKEKGTGVVIEKGSLIEGENKEIYYPQIKGLGDVNREECVNDIIKEEATKRITSLTENGTFHREEICLYLDYEINLNNSKILSIFYDGRYGVIEGERLFPTFMGSTINIQNGETVYLKEIVTDFGKLYDMLANNEFESLGIWDGAKVGEDFSEVIYGDYYSKEKFIAEMKDEKKYGEWIPAIHNIYTRVDWYLMEDKMAIIVSPSSSYYYSIYTITYSKILDIIDSDFYNEYLNVEN